MELILLAALVMGCIVMIFEDRSTLMFGIYLLILLIALWTWVLRSGADGADVLWAGLFTLAVIIGTAYNV